MSFQNVMCKYLKGKIKQSKTEMINTVIFKIKESILFGLSKGVSFFSKIIINALTIKYAGIYPINNLIPISATCCIVSVIYLAYFPLLAFIAVADKTTRTATATDIKITPPELSGSFCFSDSMAKTLKENIIKITKINAFFMFLFPLSFTKYIKYPLENQAEKRSLAWS